MYVYLRNEITVARSQQIRKLLLELRQSRLVLVVLLLVLLFTQDWFAIVMHLFTIPYSQFNYPMEIDLRSLVDQAEAKGELPKWSPAAINAVKFPIIHLNAARCRQKLQQQKQQQQQRQQQRQQQKQQLHLLIMIKSSVGNARFRAAVRSTWVQQRHYGPGFVVQHAFVLGATSDPTLQARVNWEQARYGDIVQHGLTDAYFNNTMKLMFAFEWIVQHCPMARHVLFADDDYFVNPRSVRQLLDGRDPNLRWIVGYVFERPIPKRSWRSKWYTALGEYPFSQWPPYPTGGAFIVSKRLCLSISIAQRFVKYLRFDDVFIGIVLKKLRLKPEHHSMFYYFCTLPLTQWMYANTIAVHLDKRIDLMFDLWRLMNFTSS